ncbi:uncharacterized protein LOC143297020 [Babylonia areolata]|uniref:uncharacterized protein LOC143297020 n=1 Tax=Babylonia areolata TaxID=304850 RepID=UPI003FD06BBC
MTTIRSSVRPASSKQPWGTILKPEFGLGYQKMTNYEIEQTVSRLYTVPEGGGGQRDSTTGDGDGEGAQGKTLPKDQFDAMMERLTTVEKEKIPDSDRRVNSSIYKDMGVVSSYAWKGYN